MDPELNPADKVVFAALAWIIWQQNGLDASQGQIAALVHVSERHVARSLKRLAKCGHITPNLQNKPGRCGEYKLSSPVFQANANKVPCLKCSKPTAKLNRAGWCKRCTASVELRFARSA